MKKKETSLVGVATLAIVISVLVGATYKVAPYFYSAGSFASSSSIYESSGGFDYKF